MGRLTGPGRANRIPTDYSKELFITKPLTPVSEMGFLMPTDDADFARVMNYLWHLSDIRGDLTRAESAWLK